jgi:hypothetical protein
VTSPKRALSVIVAAAPELSRADGFPATTRLSADIERAEASGHELRELALLASLRAGRTRLPAHHHDEARRLIGGYGTDVAARLGIHEDLDPGQVWTLTEEALHRWRKESENPALSQHQRRAAGTVVRSCEGVLTELARAHQR